MLEVVVLIVVIGVYVLSGLRIVQQNTEQVVETLGKYSTTLTAGVNIIFRPFQKVVGFYNLSVQNLDSHVSIKTKDSQFVDLPVKLLYKIDNAFKVHYSLSNPSQVINNMVLNAIRPSASNMTLDELFADRAQMKNEVKDALDHLLHDYGVSIVDLLIDQPLLTSEAQEAFNAVLLAEKARQAAQARGEATRITIELEAKAEAEGQRLRAQGLADARLILAKSLRDSIADLELIGAGEAVRLLLETNRIDAMRVMAKESNNLIIMDTNKEAPVIVNGGK